MTQVVFNVDTVEPAGPGRWRVAGRAYEDVTVGETVFPGGPAAEPPLTGKAPMGAYEVVSISTYGHDLPTLNRMLTGLLLLEGPEDGGILTTEFLRRS